jgi:hypothetical protein
MFAIIAAAVLCFGVTAHAQAMYSVEVAADNTLSSCAIAGDGSGLVSVHVFLTGSAGTTAVIFGAYVPSCWAGATWLGDNLAEPWLTLGTTQSPGGLSIAFGECRSLPIYLGHITFAGVPSEVCCALFAGAPADFLDYDTAVVVDCAFDDHDASGSRVLLNADSSCPCQQPLAVQESTWGRVKALYR